MPTDLTPLKAIQWERTKGELRAFHALSGSGHGNMEKYLKVQKAIEDFIKDFEDEALHE